VDFLLAEQVVPALLQASKFSDQPWKRRAIELIELMPWSSLASHVRAYFAYRKSLILLTNRDLQGAKQAITTYFAYAKQLDSLADCRLNAIHGYLQHSLAWIAFKSDRFDEALALADDWSPFCPNDSTLPICELRASLKLRKMRGIAKMHAIRYSEKASGAIDESAFRQTAYTSAYWTSVGSNVEANSQDKFSDAISPFGYYIDSSSIEELFRNITRYFEKSCPAMILDNYGALPAPDSAELCNSFDSYCFTATMFLEKGSYVEFRHALSKACALVEQILRAKHPRTLACFFEVFIHLIQTGLPRLTSYLREYVKRMSARVIQQGHPWGQIFWHLGELDSESLEQVLARAWKCTADIFDRELGAFSSLAVSYRLDYIKRVFGITNYPEEEQLLRDLLAQFGDNPTRSTPRVMLNLAHNLNRQRRHDEAEKIALEVLSLLPKHEMYDKRIVERIESLKIVSRSQFDQGSILLAEKTIRMAIQMIVDQWGVQHPWVHEFMNVLEGWLRSESREKDANTVKEEIKKLMGEDEISEQLTGV
jgi:tetratricopeptide (TPR) repeat protein